MDNTILEQITLVLNVAFLLLIIKRKVIAWPFGILASTISIYLFYEVKLYSEVILYIFYVLAGFYGWIRWRKDLQDNDELIIKTWNMKNHLIVIFIGLILSFNLGFYFENFTDANRSYYDSASTIFSLIATYMEAEKILSAWYFWIVINAYSIWLYFDVSLPWLSGQMIFFTIMSFVGLYSWRKVLK